MGAFSIVNNISALNAQNRLTVTEQNLRRTLTRLSSGLRINRASDDAAGLAIGSGLKADVMALNQGARNANDGISLLQTSDSALSEVTNLLTRAVTLAEQAASGTSGADNSDSKTALDDEFQDILTEIERIAASVEFNSLNLLGGASTGTSTGNVSIEIQVGLDDSATSRISIQTVSVNVQGTARLDSSGQVVTGFSGYTKGTVGADRISLELGMSGANLNTASNALMTLSNLQAAIDNVSRVRGNLGSGMNRLNTATTIITSLASNLQSAQSQIFDANIAEEIVNLTQFQILTQTGISALAQANIQGQNVLALLR
jgi:flagellin